jgi:hypothetical protein
MNKKQALNELEILESGLYCDVCKATNTQLSDYYLMLCKNCREKLTIEQFNEEYKKYCLRVKELKQIVANENKYVFYRRALKGLV